MGPDEMLQMWIGGTYVDVVNMVKCVKQNSEGYALISVISAIDSLVFF